MKKGIIFDFDGTLASEKQYIYGCFHATSAILEQQFGIVKAYEKLIYLFEEEWRDVFGRLLQAEKVEHTTETIDFLVQAYRQVDPVVVLYEDVKPSLMALKEAGMKLGILTNGFKQVQQKKMEKSDMAALVDDIMIPDEFGREYWKPDTRCLEKILKKWDIDPEHTVIVGDGISDYEIAQRSSIDMIYIERPDHVGSSDTIYTQKRICNLKELERMV